MQPFIIGVILGEESEIQPRCLISYFVILLC